MLLVVGSGPFLRSLVHALSASGTTGYQIEDKQVASWRERVRPFRSVLYVSQDGRVDELRELHAACREENKIFLPALCAGRAGWVGPLVRPSADACWESAWRSIHLPALAGSSTPQALPSVAGDMLAHVMASEWLKLSADEAAASPASRFYRLDLETLEGGWHTFVPHPLVGGNASVRRIKEAGQPMGPNPVRPHRPRRLRREDGLFACFQRLTSTTSGVFHRWEEGGLEQLPLAQCSVQPVDPLSEGPAALLPEAIRSGLTHDEARREAGLAGLEAYAARLSGLFPEKREGETLGIGAGATLAEGAIRGLQACLSAEQAERRAAGLCGPVAPARIGAVADARCRFYWRSLATIRGAEPSVGLERGSYGFPVVWTGLGGERLFGQIGLNRTLALRGSLQQALQAEQNRNAPVSPPSLAPVPQVRERTKTQQEPVPARDRAQAQESAGAWTGTQESARVQVQRATGERTGTQKADRERMQAREAGKAAPANEPEGVGARSFAIPSFTWGQSASWSLFQSARRRIEKRGGQLRVFELVWGPAGGEEAAVRICGVLLGRRSADE